jgi:hypothetical protein
VTDTRNISNSKKGDMKNPINKKRADWRPFERPGESRYEKDSRGADVILAKQRDGRKTRLKNKKKNLALTPGFF